MSAAAGSVEFARIRVSAAQRTLWVNEQPATVGARAFDLLLALVERRDRVVSKNELLDVAWPNLVVEEANLHVQVSALRKLIGHGCISTVPGRGYRFIGAIEGADAAPAAPVSAPPPSAPASVLAATTVELKTNLPESLPALIGRADDLALLGNLITSHRLVTITGAGGMGKTRVAQQLLHDRRRVFEHGVVWVELSALSDPTLLPSAVAGALGMQMSGDDSLKGLVAALKPLTLLVALDNAEHLIDGVARVAQAIIDGAPHVRLLVTSQVALKRPDERVYRLGALDVPEAAVPPDEAMTYAAVELFVERAQAADRHFALTEQNVASVIGVCQHLDGLALAIELAAARVAALGVTRLAAGLSERLRLLTGGNRGAPQRQQTLRAALEWSHALLSPVEQAVYRRLGVFAGSFSLEMTQQVLADRDGDEALDEWAVVDTLSALVDRSLVAADLSELPRYRLLESPRAFALEQLAAAGEDAEYRRRHAQAVLAHFEALNDDCWEGRIGVYAMVTALEPDLDNAREALAWALKHDAHTAVALAPPLNFAFTYSRREEAARMWEATEKLLSPDLPERLRANWALRHSYFWSLFRPAVVNAWARLAIELHRRLADSRGLYLSLGSLAGSDLSRACDERRAALDEMCSIEQPTWSARVRCFGAEHEYSLHMPSGDFGAARAALLRLRDLATQAGDPELVHMVMNNLVDLDLAMGRVDDAVRNGEALEAHLRSTRHQYPLAMIRVTLTGALLAQGSVARAREIAEMAWPMASQFGLQFGWPDALSLLSALEGRWRNAAQIRGYSDAIYAKLGMARQVNEGRSAARAETLARQQIGDAEYERLKSLGAGLGDDDVAALAFDPDWP